MATNRNRAGLITESSTLFPNNITQEISPQDLRDWIADGTTSFVTQKDKSTLENAIYEARSTALASAATTDLSLASGNYVHITGTTTITSFGTCLPGARFVLVFDDVLLLTYNATSLIIPGAANKTTAAGDACMIISEGSGNWKIVGYFAISGSGGGGGITALTGDVTASGTGSVAATIAVDAVDIPMLSATGTPDSTTFLRGDNTWATPSGASPTGYYGAFQDNTTQTAASINTAYAVKLNTTELSNNVTVVNDGSGNPTRVTMANAGIYNIQFSLQLEKTGGSGNMITDIWIRKNGVNIADTTGKVVLTGSANASPIVAAWNYVLDLAAGDYIQLMWSTSNVNVEIVAATATAPHPSIPSAILTVTQQSGIMAGTGITSINSLTGAAQTIATGTSGTDFAVVSSGTSHSLNLPDASASARGVITTGAQTLAGIKTFGNGTSAGEIRLLEPSGTGTETVRIKSQPMTTGYDFILPAAAGTAGDFLQYGTGGNLAWANPNTYGFYRSFRIGTQGVASNSSSIIISNSVEIPAGSFSAGDMATIIASFYKTPTTIRGYNAQILINTTNSVSGATLLSSLFNGGTALYSVAVREISIFSTGGSGQTIIKNTTTPSTDFNTYGVFATNAASFLTIDWSVTQYLIYTLAQAGGTTSTEFGYNAGLSITSR
jgi:hypothetical protein